MKWGIFGVYIGSENSFDINEIDEFISELEKISDTTFDIKVIDRSIASPNEKIKVLIIIYVLLLFFCIVVYIQVIDMFTKKRYKDYVIYRACGCNCNMISHYASHGYGSCAFHSTTENTAPVNTPSITVFSTISIRSPKLQRLIMRGMTPITRRKANVPAETAMPQAVARPAIKMCLRNIVFMPLSSRVLYKRHIDILFILSHLNLNRCRI